MPQYSSTSSTSTCSDGENHYGRNTSCSYSSKPPRWSTVSHT
ncbi:unnamed protein product [Heligmosomoides polygyrus]|uniref:Uncharacterized protein n=1 Tax=Heligmosomoides polygyrus TaxID=6339 RepID=A0A3P7TFI5_HELPZ|nr:unnamed protein product [Heligmosomoides polygyrus]